jgi:hypothetical protein
VVGRHLNQKRQPLILGPYHRPQLHSLTNLDRWTPGLRGLAEKRVDLEIIVTKLVLGEKEGENEEEGRTIGHIFICDLLLVSLVRFMDEFFDLVLYLLLERPNLLEDDSQSDQFANERSRPFAIGLE